MFRIITLGGAALRGPAEATSLDRLVAHGKAFALLAYLAAAPGKYFHRDHLLGLFWPESDQRRARHSLRQAVYRIRGVIGATVIMSRGRDEIAVDPDEVWCDLAALDQALARGDLPSVTELYGGPFLPGHFVADAPGAQDWIDTTRSRVRRLAAEAMVTLSASALDLGNGREALEHARRARRTNPDSEPAVRAFMAAMAATGDRAGALLAYGELEERLAEEYGAEPSVETSTLAGRIRASEILPAPSPATPPVAPIAESGEADRDAGAVASTPALEALYVPAARRTRFRPRPLTAAIVALACLILWGAALSSDSPIEAPVPGDLQRVVVLPFEYGGSPDLAHLATGVPALLSLQLQSAGLATIIEPHVVTAAVPDGDGLGPRAAGHFDAAYFVTGRIVEVGGRVSVETRLSRRNGSEWTTRETRGSATGVFDLIDDLVRALAPSLYDGPEPDFVRTAALTSGSIEALAAFTAGEASYWTGEYRAARNHYDRAVELDSTFALAWYRLTVTEDWLRGGPLSRSSMRQALLHRDRLPTLYRELLDGYHGYHQRDPARAVAAFRRVLTRAPHNVEAWNQLGETIFHLGWRIGLPQDSARHAFQRVLELQPDYLGARVHLSRLAALTGDLVGMDTLTRSLPDGDHEGLELALLRAATLGVSPDQGRALRTRFDALQPGTRTLLAYRVGRYARDPMAGLALTPATNTTLATQLLCAAGRPGDALERYEAPEEVAWMLALPERKTPPREAARVAAAILDEAVRDSPRSRAAALVATQKVAAAHVLLASSGQTTMERARRELTATAPVDSKVDGFVALVEATLAARANDRRRVLDALALRPDTMTGHESVQAYTALLRGDAMLHLGDYPTALDTYAAAPEDLVFMAPLRLRAAAAAEASGRFDEASRLREAAACIWRDAEPALKRELAGNHGACGGPRRNTFLP